LHPGSHALKTTAEDVVVRSVDEVREAAHA
jgi:hypothetical protein